MARSRKPMKSVEVPVRFFVPRSAKTAYLRQLVADALGSRIDLSTRGAELVCAKSVRPEVRGARFRDGLKEVSIYLNEDLANVLAVALQLAVDNFDAGDDPDAQALLEDIEEVRRMVAKARNASIIAYGE